MRIYLIIQNVGIILMGISLLCGILIQRKIHKLPEGELGEKIYKKWEKIGWVNALVGGIGMGLMPLTQPPISEAIFGFALFLMVVWTFLMAASTDLIGV